MPDLLVQGDGFVTCYRVDKKSGSLTRVCTQATNGRGNTSVTFDRTGRFLLVTRYWEHGVSVLPFDPENGVIGEVCAAPQHEGSGPHPLRQTDPHPHGFHGDPHSDLLYAMDLGTDRVVQYRLDTTSGCVSHVSDVSMGSGMGPRGMVFHPRLRVAYVNCELGGVVVACTADPAAGLTPFQTAPAYPPDFEGGEGHPQNFGKAAFWTAEAAITPDGLLLLVICRVHQSIAIFRVDPTDGSLALAGRQPLAECSNARNLTLDPSGKFVLVACQDADRVDVFRVDAETAVLTETDSKHAPCAADVAVM